MFLRTVLLACSSLVAACSSGNGGGSDLAAPCTPVASAVETVTVNDQFGVLEGTLEVPAGCVGMPVVLVLSGSGPEDRDGNPPGDTNRTDMYKLLALGLKDAGFATLRFDDPGVGRSAKAIPNDVSTYTYDMEVDASGAWIPKLRGDARFGPVVLAGHSQGSLTSILLAGRGSVDAVLSLEGPGRAIDRVLRDQLAPRLTTAQLMTLDAVLAKLKAGEIAGPQQPPLDQVFAEVTQRYLISLFKYDPAVEIAKLTMPVMIVQGLTDAQVSIEDAQRLAQAKPSAQLTVIDDMCHTLKQAAEKDFSTQTAQYSDPTVPLHPALVPDLAAFVKTVSRRP